jgi:hypothetical protein
VGAEQTSAGGADAADELDRLIGDLEAEAARRRAEPTFPLATDGRLRAELDRLSPGRIPSVAELLAAVLDAGAAPAPAPGLPAGRGRRAAPAPPVGPDPRLQDLSAAVAVALQALFDRTAVTRPVAAEPAGGGGAADLVRTWWAELERRPRRGPALCAGEAGEVLAARLEGLGLAADPVEGDSEDLAARLRGLPAAGCAVVAAGVGARSPAELADLVGALGHAASSVEVLSVAPWWWRQGRTAASAALAPDRPLAAEVWVEELTRAGFTTTARYDGLGRTYEVVATRPDLAGA